LIQTVFASRWSRTICSSEGSGRLLASVGFDVSLFSSAEEFPRVDQSHRLACWRTFTCRLGGLDLAAVLRELDRQLAVFITADDSVARSDAMVRSGATCLTKPFEEDRLLSALVRASAPMMG
jgi:FixJ family two-component response regulator